MRNRYYDPHLARFVSRDPIGLDGGENLYVYVRNNPLKFVDTDGLMLEMPNGPRSPRVRKFIQYILEETMLQLYFDVEWKVRDTCSTTKKVKNKILREIMLKILRAKEWFYLDFAENDPKILMGSFLGTGRHRIDIGDIDQAYGADTKFGSGNLTHELAEMADGMDIYTENRLDWGNKPYNYPERGYNDVYTLAHNVALGAEARAMGYSSAERSYNRDGTAAIFSYRDRYGDVARTYRITGNQSSAPIRIQIVR